MRTGFLLVLLSLPTFGRDKKKVTPATANTATVLSAKEIHFKKKVDAWALQKQLVAADFAINYIDCSVDNCTIHMQPTETKDPMPIVDKYVYADPRLERQKKMDAMRTLYSKWQDGTITPQEKDDLLKRLAAHVLGL